MPQQAAEATPMAGIRLPAEDVQRDQWSRAVVVDSRLHNVFYEALCPFVTNNQKWTARAD